MSTTSAWYRFTTLVFALLTAGLVALAAINFQQRGIYQLPDDGVSWLDTPAGVQAWIVTRSGPADRAGIRDPAHVAYPAAAKEKIARRDSLLSASAALKRRLVDAKGALDRALRRKGAD